MKKLEYLKVKNFNHKTSSFESKEEIKVGGDVPEKYHPSKLIEHLSAIKLDVKISDSIKGTIHKLSSQLPIDANPSTLNSIDGSTVGIFWEDPYFSIQIDDGGPFSVTDYFEEQNFKYFEDEDQFISYASNRYILLKTLMCQCK